MGGKDCWEPRKWNVIRIFEERIRVRPRIRLTPVRVGAWNARMRKVKGRRLDADADKREGKRPLQSDVARLCINKTAEAGPSAGWNCKTKSPLDSMLDLCVSPAMSVPWPTSLPSGRRRNHAPAWEVDIWMVPPESDAWNPTGDRSREASLETSDIW